MSEHIQPHSGSETLGRYTILQRLGRGGMGDVWLGEDPRLHRQVAIKTLPVRKAQDRDYIERFEREAQSAAALNHPHILPVHDYGRQALPDESVIPYIVMPYIRGGSLADRVEFYTQHHQLMPTSEALTLLEQAAQAIDYAHGQLLIHRDIKPENMLLRDQNWLLLADFGIARMLTDARQATITGRDFGTALYMAPEQARGQVVSSSDNYSLAVVAYQLFTGNLPFQAETAYATTIQHLTMPPPSPRQFNPYLPQAFEQVLLKGLAKEPAGRFPTAGAFARALRDTATGEFTKATYQPATPTPTILPNVGAPPALKADERETVRIGPGKSSPTRRRFLLVGGAAAVLAAGGGLTTWEIISRRSPVKAIRPAATRTPVPRSPDAALYTLTEFNYKADALAWQPQHHLLAALSEQDGRLITWDIDIFRQQAGKQPAIHQRISLPTLGTEPTLTWSADGTRLRIFSSGSENVDIDVETLNPQTFMLASLSKASIPLSNPANQIQTFGWIQEKYLLVVEQGLSNNNFENLLFLIDPARQPLKRWQLANLGENFTSLAVSPDGSKIALNLSDTLQIGLVVFTGQTPQWQVLISLKEPPDKAIRVTELGQVAWSADGKQIITASAGSSNGGPAFWNWQESNPQVQPLNPPAPTSAAASIPGVVAIQGNPSAGSAAFAIGYDNGTIYLWNTTTGTGPVRTLETGISQSVGALAWSHDGQWLTASFADTNASMLVWQMEAVIH